MTKLYVVNALSLNMINEGAEGAFVVNTITAARAAVMVAEAKDEGALRPAIGHSDTAAVAATALGVQIEDVGARANVMLDQEDGDVLLVCQYRGPRLPEGAVSLPPGASMEWKLVIWVPAK